MTDVGTTTPNSPAGNAAGLSTRSHPDDAGMEQPEQRGTTVIQDAVVEHIARLAAGAVPGVAQAGSGLDKVIGRQYPKVDAHVAGQRARLAVDIAVLWPTPVADVCAKVRDTVTTRLVELTGLSIDAVDVTVVRVLHDIHVSPRRVQ